MPDTARSFPRALAAALTALLAESPGAHAQSEADLSWYEQREPAAEASTSAAPNEGNPVAAGSAAPRMGHGFVGLGLSLAYGIPSGDFAEDSPYRRTLRGELRPALDLHYFFTPRIGVGAYVGPGVGFSSKDGPLGEFCELDGASCRLWVVDAGAFAEFRQPLAAHVLAFVQLNVGYEHLRNVLEASQGGQSVTGKLRAHGVGFGVTVGADYDAGQLGVGPFFSAQLGSYRALKLDFDADGIGGDSITGDLRTAVHAMLLFGVRGRYEL